jgi:hypothetical protein
MNISIKYIFLFERRIIRPMTLDKADLRPYLFTLIPFQFAVAAHVSRSAIILSTTNGLTILHAAILAQSLSSQGTRLALCVFLLRSRDHRNTSNGTDWCKARSEIILHIINCATAHIGRHRNSLSDPRARIQLHLVSAYWWHIGELPNLFSIF